MTLQASATMASTMNKQRRNRRKSLGWSGSEQFEVVSFAVTLSESRAGQGKRKAGPVASLYKSLRPRDPDGVAPENDSSQADEVFAGPAALVGGSFAPLCFPAAQFPAAPGPTRFPAAPGPTSRSLSPLY